MKAKCESDNIRWYQRVNGIYEIEERANPGIIFDYSQGVKDRKNGIGARSSRGKYLDGYYGMKR